MTVDYNTDPNRHVRDFIDATLAPDRDSHVTASDLHDAYTRWCTANNITGTSMIGLGRKLSAAGMTRTRTARAVRYIGVRFRNPATPDTSTGHGPVTPPPPTPTNPRPHPPTTAGAS